MSTTTRAIQELDQTINSFQSQVDVKVSAVKTSTDNVQATTDQIYANIEKFKTNMMHGEEKQIAHENVLRIDQIIKEQFGNHTDIRRTILGVVRDFDINLVRNSTIQELSEELWITSSRYWLSYALIAITAWVNDYPEIAKNALSESGRIEPVKTTLFFCLLNLRFGRAEAAKLWFYEYFSTLDPGVLQQETAVLLQAFLNGIFGKDKELEHKVVDLLEGWVAHLKNDEVISQEINSSINTYIKNINPAERRTYDALLEFSPSAEGVMTTHREISKYNELLAFVDSLDVETEPQDDANYKSRIDIILTNLISNYDAEELELKKQQEYYQLVIENDGVIDIAESQFQAKQALEGETFSFGRQLTRWAFYDTSEQTNIHVRKFAFQNLKSWFLGRTNVWHENVVDAKIREFPLQIDTWRSTSNGQDQTEQIENMTHYFENNKFSNMYVNTPNIAAVIAFVLSIGLAFVTPFSLVVTLVSAGFLIYRVLKAKKDYDVRVKAAVTNLNRCMDEISRYQDYFEEQAAKRDELLSKVEFL